jgi:uridylate kinase
LSWQAATAASLREYAQPLKELAAEHHIFVVVGGGRIAREYIAKARAFGASEMFVIPSA